MNKQRILLLISLLLAVFGALLIYNHQQKIEKAYGATVKIVIANQDISAGNQFTQDNVSKWDVPRRFMPTSAVLVSEYIKIMDRRTLVDLKKGQPVLWNFVDAGLQSSRLSQLIPPGERGYTISVDPLNSHAGMIKVGDRVDFLFTALVPGRNLGQKMVTRTLLQSVTILAVGNRFGALGLDGGGSYPTVTIGVSPQEAEILNFAESMGKIRLLLRNPQDLKIDEEKAPVNFLNLFGLGKAENRKKKKKNKFLPKVKYE